MTKHNVGIVIAILIASVALGVAMNKSRVLGGVTEWQKKSFMEGFFAGNSRQLEVQNDGDFSTQGDITIGGGLLTVTTSNSATSTAIIGCTQTYATSTATAISIVYNSIGTSSTNMLNGQTANGHVFWRYGSCPR